MLCDVMIDGVTSCHCCVSVLQMELSWRPWSKFMVAFSAWIRSASLYRLFHHIWAPALAPVHCSTEYHGLFLWHVLLCHWYSVVFSLLSCVPWAGLLVSCLSHHCRDSRSCNLPGILLPSPCIEFQSRRTLRTILTSVKNKPAEEKVKGVVYQVDCSCGNPYIVHCLHHSRLWILTWEKSYWSDFGA